MEPLSKLLSDYAHAVGQLAGAPSTTEATYYPALQSLLNGLLREAHLPFEVRTNTSQRRSSGGVDLPDLAFYDGAGDFVVVLGEVKTPAEELGELALSTAREDQIGRYLAQTGVVLLSNVRGFALLTSDPGFQQPGPVPPAHRRLLEVVELWPSASALGKSRAPLPEAAAELAALLETAVTEFAPIAEPESLARILARQARRAKQALPARFSQAVQPLLEDFAKALGLHFEGSEGEEFLPRDRATFDEIAGLGDAVAILLDPLADATRVLRDLLGSAPRSLAVVRARESEVVREGDLQVTVPYYGGAQGAWTERAPREPEASDPSWGETTGELWLNDTIFLANVPQQVWRYELGGYPVIKKWLGYRDDRRRPGRGLTVPELDHLREIVHRLAALLLLREKLDGAYERAVADPFTREELGLG